MKIKTILKRISLTLAVIILIVSILTAIEYFGGHPMGLFSGSTPTGLGFNNGQFKPPSSKPNTVSSTVEKSDIVHYIEPIAFGGDPVAVWDKLTRIVKAEAGATVITEKPDYIYAEFKSAKMGFVDDVEFALDAKANVVQVRSSSRLGVRDLGVNRKRIEAIRVAFGK